MNGSQIKVLLGKTLTHIDAGENEIRFTTSEGETYLMYHEQDCCESVYVEDIAGDLSDLLNKPIFMAEEVSHAGPEEEYGDSSTWTFYKLATISGTITIRWLGTSNGYYSESVDFMLIKKGDV
jgi:hypothetical protein